MSGTDRELPAVGEEIHLPGPTLIPFITAIAITLVVIGTTINPIFSAVGLIVFVGCVYRWVKDTRRDVAELPEEEH